MTWLKIHRRSAVVVGVTLLLPLCLYLYVLIGMLGARYEYQADIDRYEPRLARLQGLIEYEQQLRESSGIVEQKLQGLVYPASEQAATISATLQKDVRGILAAAGLSVTNSQVLPVVKQGRFEEIGLRLTLSGGIDGLDSALASITAYKPVLLVKSLNVSPARTSRRGKGEAGQSLTATLQLLAMRDAQ